MPRDKTSKKATEKKPTASSKRAPATKRKENPARINNSEEKIPQAKKRKTTGKDFDNAAFSLKAHNRQGKKPRAPNKEGLLHIRSNTQKTVFDKEGNEVALKTSILLVDMKDFIFDQTLWQLFLKNFDDQVEKIPSYRPIAKVIKYSQTGSPEKVVTPQKNTKMYRYSHYGNTNIFSNVKVTPQPHPHAAHATVTAMSSEDFKKFKSTAQYKKIKKFFAPYKEQKIQVTKELFAQTDKERRDAGYVRAISQNAAMAVSGQSTDGSATKYITESKLLSSSIDLSWKHFFDWLHAVAHEIAGAKTQCMDNLVGGTIHANTDMMFVEAQLRKIAKFYEQGFTLEVKAGLIEVPEESSDESSNDDSEESTSSKKQYLQIGTVIEYHIITADFRLEFVFNAQNPLQPLLVNRDYIAAIIDGLLLALQQRELLNTSQSLSPSPDPSPQKSVSDHPSPRKSPSNSGIFSKAKPERIQITISDSESEEDSAEVKSQAQRRLNFHSVK